LNVKNIFDIPEGNPEKQESFETLIKNQNLLIERIITHKPYDIPGKWYDQEKDEWVVLLEGEAEIEFRDKKNIKLFKGDYIFIPAHKTHRIKETTSKGKCIWLAVHGNLK